jgi:hypothetical protein
MERCVTAMGECECRMADAQSLSLPAYKQDEGWLFGRLRLAERLQHRDLMPPREG